MNTYDPTGSGNMSTYSAEEKEWNLDDLSQMQVPMGRIADIGDIGGTGFEGQETLSGEKAQENATNSDALGVVGKNPEQKILLAKHPVSGCYQGQMGCWQLLLRADVDGKRPMKKVSGDFFRVSGATCSYFGSFVVHSPQLNVSSNYVVINGVGSYTFSADCPKVRVLIPRKVIFLPPTPANVLFISLSNQPGAAYTCQFVSRAFRTVHYEQDYVEGVKPFISYNTGSLPSGGPARTLTVYASYAEAGVEMLSGGGINEVPLSGAGANARWSNAELHGAMELQFSLWTDEPQWKVWLLEAYLHDMGPSLYGIMFDLHGKQRQGCAAFHAGIGGSSAVALRNQLYTYVHELGHCFNLFHSFQKKYMTPPMPNRFDALSWMNYPQYYQGQGGSGSTSFWNAFAFQFDDLEVAHLRHAFRNNIIMGGNPFGIGAALESPQDFADRVEDHSGLQFTLEAPKPFILGEPVVLEFKLNSTDTRGKKVHSQLHPNMGFVQLAIRKPGGQVMAYEPMLEHCVIPEITVLDTQKPAIYDSAYIGYGKDGFYFDQVGVYKLRAVYYALDGSEVLSNTLNLRVRSPLSVVDEEVADLFFGDNQGKLLYLLGSDNPFLQSGNDAFDLMLEKYGSHPLAVYAKLVKGTNLGREFKKYTPQRKFILRKPNFGESVDLLSAVVSDSEKEIGVDNITLNQTMRFLAGVHKSAGDMDKAKDTMKKMIEIFSKKSLKPHVMKHIKTQAAEI